MKDKTSACAIPTGKTREEYSFKLWGVIGTAYLSDAELNHKKKLLKNKKGLSLDLRRNPSTKTAQFDAEKRGRRNW